MSKQLYEEAIADLKKVREIAEDNAKRAVVEAVAPRIRELIEKELLSEGLDEEDEEEVVDKGKDSEDKKSKLIVEPKKDEDDKKIVDLSKLASDKSDDEDKQKSESVSSSIKNLVSSKTPSNVHEMDQKLRYVEKMIETLAKVDTTITESTTFDSDLSHMGDMIDVIYGFVQERIEDPTTRLGYGLRIRKCLEKLEKLQETTMKRNPLNEDKVTIELDLPGVDLGDVLDDAAVDLVLDEAGEEEEAEASAEESEAGAEEAPAAGAEEGGEEDEGLLEVLNLSDDAVVEIDENMLRREIAFMKLLREADESESAPSTDGTAPGADEFDDFGGAEEEDEALDLDLSEGYMDEVAVDETDPKGPAHAAGTAAPAGTAPKEEAKPGLDDEDELLELYMDEMDAVSQSGGKRHLNGEHDPKFVQATVQQDTIKKNESVRSQMAKELKLQESLRKRASELKKLYESTKKAASKATTIVETKQISSRSVQLKAAYAETAERYNRSVTRFNNLSQSLSEGTAKNVRSNSNVNPGTGSGNTLDKKLAETNLLNAKLLFTNKLLQTESLTARQKAQVIEQLDAAETIREAKLVYESLSKALVKPRRTVTESRVLGSSSQATRAASTQTLNEGIEAERWARLAGISK